MDKKNLFGMINFSYGLDKWEKIPDEFSPQANENYLVEIIISTFVQHCEKLLKQGLYKSYVTHQEDISYLRGKLLLKQHLLNVLQNKAKFACEFDELEYDNLENQILLFCLKRSYHLTKNEMLRKKIRMQFFQFEGVISEKAITIHDFAKLNYTRQNKDYLPAHLLCELLVKSSGIVSFYSEKMHRVQSFFVNMNEIFEKFVYHLFKKYLDPGKYDIKEQKTKPAWNISGGGTKNIRTDIWLKNKKTGEITIIDTKCKPEISDSDLYQVGFYVHEYRAESEKDKQKTGYLILPISKEEGASKKMQEFVSSEQKIKIIKSHIDLNEIIPLLLKTDEKSVSDIQEKIMCLIPGIK